MKKIVSLKLIIFSLLLVTAGISYSAPPVIKAGTAANSTEAGIDNEALKLESSAFGFKNIADESGSSAFGNANRAIGEFSSAFGFHNIASGRHSSAFGSSNEADGDFSSAFGFKNKISGKWSSAFGNQYEVTGEKSGTFGVGNFNGQYQNKNEGNNSYMIGNYNKIAKDSNDNFILGNNVTIGARVQKSVVLGDGSASGGSNTVSVGSATLKRKIVNVGDGTISATSTDAVTGKQLYAMQNSNNNFKNEVYEKIDNVKDEVREVGSLSAALAGLHPMQYDPKAPAQVMAALGHYKNKQAIAVGANYYFNDRFMMSTGIALSGEKKTKTMANVGFTLKLGKGSGVSYNETPLYTIQDEVKRLTLENNKQAKENQELKAKVELQGVENQELKERVKNLEEKLNKLLKNK